MQRVTISADNVAEKNISFWNELCGSQLAAVLGITDDTAESLKKFDDWYFDFYPYLTRYLSPSVLMGKDVLEVGLGYGTVSQYIASSGAEYSGLDIASGPVSMVNHRIHQEALSGIALQGSILEPPFEASSFDTIVAIGCLHHTGHLKLALDKCWNLLRPGGKLIFMVYNAYSYRRWRTSPKSTFSYLLKEFSGYRGVVGECSVGERSAYDVNSKGGSAPHTDWISIESIVKLCDKFSQVETKLENIGHEMPFKYKARSELLKTIWPSKVGLDLYVIAEK